MPRGVFAGDASRYAVPLRDLLRDQGGDHVDATRGDMKAMRHQFIWRRGSLSRLIILDHEVIPHTVSAAFEAAIR